MVISCIVNILWFLYIPYCIYNYKAKKNRQKRGIIEATSDVDGYQSLIAWFMFYILSRVVVILAHFEHFQTGNESAFVAMELFCSFPLIIIYSFTRWRIILEDNEIIKYGIFKKRYKYEDITEIRYKGLTYTFYNGKKILFSMCARGHDFPKIFIPMIEQRAGIKDYTGWW